MKIINIFNKSIIIQNKSFIQFVKYLIVGGFCTIIDISLLYTLVTFIGLNYLIASIISFIISAIINYYLCVNWIFSIRVFKKYYQEFSYYIIISLIGLAINTLLIWSFTEFLGFYFIISKIFAAGGTFVWNFGARKYFLHTIRK